MTRRIHLLILSAVAAVVPMAAQPAAEQPRQGPVLAVFFGATPYSIQSRYTIDATGGTHGRWLSSRA